MKPLGKTSIVALLLAAPLVGANAGGVGTVAGLTLTEAPTARAFSLGESLVAGSDDVSTLGYNPAALTTLRTGQASFLYQKGLVDDSYGHFTVGAPSRHGGFGLSVGYYDGGKFDIGDDNGGTRSVIAQRDLALSLGAARRLGALSVGVTGKYLSSEIAQTARATAYAADLGLSLAAGQRLRLGASVQNLGTALKYADHGDDLPRMARVGGALTLGVASLLVDGTYRMVEKQFEPAAGIEVALGVMALRAGYRGGSAKEFSLGTGFFTGRASLDYSFGMTAGDLSASHRISYSFRFGGRSSMVSELASAARARTANQIPVTASASPSAAATRELTAYAPSAGRTTVEISPATPIARRTPRTHEIKAGETLASIARDEYGDARLWRTIYQANSHLLADPEQVVAGQKIILP